MPRGRGGRMSGRRGGRRSARGGGVKKVTKDKTKEETKIHRKPNLATPFDVFTTTEFEGATISQHVELLSGDELSYVAHLCHLLEMKIVLTSSTLSKVLAAALHLNNWVLAEVLTSKRSVYTVVEILKAVQILDSTRLKKQLERKIEKIRGDIIQGKLNYEKKKKEEKEKEKSNEPLRDRTESEADYEVVSDVDMESVTSSMITSKIDDLKVDDMEVKPSKCMRKLVVEKHNAEKLSDMELSFTKSKAQFIRQWAKTLKKSELEFFSIYMPVAPWKKLADIVHFHPKCFQLEWFLPFCYDENALPEDHASRQLRDMNEENINELLQKNDITFSRIKKFKGKLTSASVEKIIGYSDLNTLLWWYEELSSPKLDELIHSKLLEHEKENGEDSSPFTMPYGKLMERILYIYQHNNSCPFLPILYRYAEKQLHSIQLDLPSPIAVIGDRSSSMSVAVRTSSIIASLMAAACNAKLSFFNTQTREVEHTPESIEQVIEIANKTSASGATAPAASLVPYFDRKEIIRTFIIVTDEEENTKAKSANGQNYYFAKLFAAYKDEVFPAKLVFVSFLRRQHDEGEMYGKLINTFDMSKDDVLQFKFNQSRPDLTKFDNMLGVLSMKKKELSTTTDNVSSVERIKNEIKSVGLSKFWYSAKLNDDLSETQED
ncbi:hypothetical protein SNEBB_008706 [Seison nebaliae]|nr:hypothetical protein SNEBB_008706 [Seison nebaliae]